VIAFIHSLSIAIIPFDELQAEVSASLYPETKKHGMSFADRACLALGVDTKFPRGSLPSARWASCPFPSK